MVGIAREQIFGMTAALAAAWLSHRFGCRFVEHRVRDEAGLAIEVLHDELDCLFRGKAIIGVIGLTGDCAESTLSDPYSLQSLTEAGSITFRRQGLAHAFFNATSGRMQVTFDHLPGAIELVRRPSAKAPRPALPRRHADLITWYGFGEIEEGPQASLASLRTLIRHGTVDSELKIRLA